MATAAARRTTPASREELVAELAAAGEAGTPLRFLGGGTKLAWIGGTVIEPELELSTVGLDRVVEHNAGDLTALLEAGVPLARAQATFAEAGQMLAFDPPDGGATVGGIVASGDSGPLRARYGGVRDLVLGMTVALSDGTVARAGGKVIKNVAGYDLAKLFAGSFGTLGAILELAVRLHPLPAASATAAGRTADPAALALAASALAHAQLEPMGLDVRWEHGGGALLARFGGVAPRPQAEGAARLIRETGVEAEIVEEDEGLWGAQRQGQRPRNGAPDTVVRVSALQTDLPALLETVEHHGAALVGRAALGLSWVRLEDHPAADVAALVAELRRHLGVVVLDAPAEVRERVDPWGPRHPAALALMRRVKEGFDPAGVCAPGVLV
jgi:glycolate oxidase FAD binding subunit